MPNCSRYNGARPSRRGEQVDAFSMAVARAPMYASYTTLGTWQRIGRPRRLCVPRDNDSPFANASHAPPDALRICFSQLRCSCPSDVSKLQDPSAACRSVLLKFGRGCCRENDRKNGAAEVDLIAPVKVRVR